MLKALWSRFDMHMDDYLENRANEGRSSVFTCHRNLAARAHRDHLRR